MNYIHHRIHRIFLSLQILLIFANFVQTHSEIENETFVQDYFLCKNCGSDTAISNFVLYKLSPFAESAINATIFDLEPILVQEIANQVDISYKIILVQKANCAKIDITWSQTYTWFPGYAWKLCLCTKCALHLGWMYEPIKSATDKQDLPSEKGFYALIISNIVTEKFVNSLLIRQH